MLVTIHSGRAHEWNVAETDVTNWRGDSDGRQITRAWDNTELTKSGKPHGPKRGFFVGVRAASYPAGRLEGRYAILGTEEQEEQASAIRRRIADLEKELADANHLLMMVYAPPAEIVEAAARKAKLNTEDKL